MGKAKELVIYILGWPLFLLYTIAAIVDVIEMFIYRRKDK